MSPRNPVPEQPPQDEIRIEYVPLRALQRWPRNPKEHDIGAIHASVQRFGFVSPIVVDEASGRIVAGHGRLDLLLTMKKNGEQPPPRIKVRDDGDWMVPVVRGIAFASEREAEAYLIADNQATILGGWNDADLYEMLARQASEGALLGTGFDADDVDDLMKRLQAEGPGDETNRFPVFSLNTVAQEGFTYFRAAGFPYRQLPVHRQMQDLNRLAALRGDALLTSTYGHQVADTYHPHRFECHALGKRSPLDSFHDDEQLKRAIKLQLENAHTLDTDYFSMLGLVAGTQACANFRPGVACHYYRRYGKEGGIVLDPCTGYGGRLIGWIASLLGGQYIGVDPSTKTHEANMRMAAALAPEDSVTLINQPFEDVDLSEYEGQVDFAFTSPPYFSKEEYTDEPTQSRLRYKTSDSWREGFLVSLLQSCFDVLKPGSRCIINIADIKVKNRIIPLGQMTKDTGVETGFILEATEHMQLGGHFGKGEIDESVAVEDSEGKAEPVFIFRKPTRTNRSAQGGDE